MQKFKVRALASSVPCLPTAQSARISGVRHASSRYVDANVVVGNSSKWAPQAPTTSTRSGVRDAIRQLSKRPPSSAPPDSAKLQTSRDSHAPPSFARAVDAATPSTSTSTSDSNTTSFERTTMVPQSIIAHKAAMKKAFPDGWKPPKKISREAMEGLRTLHDHDPETFTTVALASRFKISPEAVRRILKSRWTPDVKRREKMAEKEMLARQGLIARKKAEARGVQNSPIPEMFMDEASDSILAGDDSGGASDPRMSETKRGSSSSPVEGRPRPGSRSSAPEAPHLRWRRSHPAGPSH